MTKTLKPSLAAVALLLTVACTDPAKAPAEAALQAADAAISKLDGDVQKFAADQVKAVKDGFAAAKLAAEKQDWKGALAAAKDLPGAAAKAVADARAKKEELEKAAAAKAAELKAAYEEAQAQLPGKIEALKKQVAALSKAKKLPAGVTKDAVAKGKDAVAALEAGFAQVAEQAKSDVQAAGARSKELMAQAAEAAQALAKK